MKKCVFVLLFVITFTTVFAASGPVYSAERVYYYGDADMDGQITGKDAFLILRHVARLEIMSGDNEKISDANLNGTVDALDALQVLKTVAKIVSPKVFTQKSQNDPANSTARVEINGNLDVPESGLRNYKEFSSVIVQTINYYKKYISTLGTKIDLYIDNATQDSGWTPVTTPVFRKFVIIKLGIRENDPQVKIAFQFAHELMHYAFYEKYGINKTFADVREESICTAASLIYIKDSFPMEFQSYVEYVKNLENEGYRKGAEVAEKVNYDFRQLVKMM